MNIYLNCIKMFSICILKIFNLVLFINNLSIRFFNLKFYLINMLDEFRDVKDIFESKKMYI